MTTLDREALRASLAPLRTDALRSAAIAAPLVAPERLLAAAPASAFLLASADGGACGIDEAVVLRAEGAERFANVRSEADAVFDRMVARGDSDAPLPRFFGGFAWQPGAASRGAWKAFGDGNFVMARWLYERTESRAFLRLTLAPGERLDAALDELDRIEASLNTPLSSGGTRYRRLNGENFDEYAERIEVITEAIDAGDFAKIVAARQVGATLGHALPLQHAVASLSRRYPACTRFAFRRGNAYFVGATPEMLIDRHGRRVASEALAGTSSSGRSEELMASRKDAAEHALVVDAIASRLTNYATLEPLPDQPQLHALPGVLHLRTPLIGELRAPSHVLTLTEALHPTPAVAGVPAAQARDWIAANEPPRGWYASPIGHFDQAGNGRFYVALRCGLVEDRRATAFAGGGIVSGSKPAAEHAESELKLEAFLGALGAEERTALGEGRRPVVAKNPHPAR
ncbi:MAG: isochorismate synthase [Myxococcota bacterium]